MHEECFNAKAKLAALMSCQYLPALKGAQHGRNTGEQCQDIAAAAAEASV